MPTVISYGPISHPDPSDRDARFMDGWRWLEYASRGLRVRGASHDIARSEDRPRAIDHTGWFTDNVFQDETVHGVVIQLPTHKGKLRFLPAVSDPNESDSFFVDFSDLQSDLLECALCADRNAEIFAEYEREYRRVESAKSQIEDLTADITDRYAAFKTLAREVRNACDKLTGLDQVKGLVRAEYRRVKSDVRRMRQQIRKLQESI